MTENDFKNDFVELEEEKEDMVHVHFLHRHIPAVISYSLLASVVGMVVVSLFYIRTSTEAARVVIHNEESEQIKFTYGSWPALQNADFFKRVKEDFVASHASFIEADLSLMIIRFYKEGMLVKESPIRSKGRDGSWWETPAGLYQIVAKERDHFSSFGQVYMPWSMQFQGNFFIHGPTRYPDGSATPGGYSGGCIRVALEDAEELYDLTEKGTPVLVFEKSFTNNEEGLRYEQKELLPKGISYLVADLENNFVFAENDSRSERSIASITKLMTALVATEYINVERETSITSAMVATTSIPRLKKGERITILDLLSLLLQESSNEAAHAIASPLGEEEFIELMNTKSEAIGMTHSHFEDTSGVLSNNISSAEDLFLLAKYLYHNRSFVLSISVGNENRKAYGNSPIRNIVNLNAIPDTTGMIGGKTGISSTAGDNMLAVFKKEIDGQERSLAIIVLGSDNAKRDIVTLLGYIENNFSLSSGSPASLFR